MKTLAPSKIAWNKITSSQAVQARLELVSRAKAIVKAQQEERNCLVGCSPTVVLAGSIQEYLPSRVKKQLGVHLFSGGEIAHFLSFTGLRTFSSVDALPFLNDTTTQEILDTNQKLRDAASFPLAVTQLIEAYRYKFVENRLNETYLTYFGEVGLFSLTEAVSLGADNLDVYQAENDSALYLLTFSLKDEQFQVIFQQEYLCPGTPVQALQNNEVGVIFISGNTNRFSFPKGAGPFLGREYILKTARFLPREAYLVLLFNNSYLSERTSQALNRPNAFDIPGYSCVANKIVGRNTLELGCDNVVKEASRCDEYEAFVFAPSS